MATNSVRLQNIFDGINDAATPQQKIDDRIDDVVLLADEKEFSDFFLPKNVVTKETATINQKRAWMLHKFWQVTEGWRKHAKRTRREIERAAADALDP